MHVSLKIAVKIEDYMIVSDKIVGSHHNHLSYALPSPLSLSLLAWHSALSSHGGDAICFQGKAASFIIAGK